MSPPSSSSSSSSSRLLLAMPYIPLSKEQLEAKHAAYVSSMEANSPARQAFIIAFSLDPMTKTTATPGPLSEKIRSPPKKQPVESPAGKGRHFETASQISWQSYVSVPDEAGFSPTKKHRYLKAKDHEYTEQMFTLWNIHGKKGSGLL